jgi:hypothetical protein
MCETMEKSRTQGLSKAAMIRLGRRGGVENRRSCDPFSHGSTSASIPLQPSSTGTIGHEKSWETPASYSRRRPDVTGPKGGIAVFFCRRQQHHTTVADISLSSLISLPLSLPELSLLSESSLLGPSNVFSAQLTPRSPGLPHIFLPRRQR